MDTTAAVSPVGDHGTAGLVHGESGQPPEPIQLFVPSYDVEACLAQMRECLERGWTGLGYKTIAFEQAWCAHTGHAHAHFLNSATSALHLALHVFKEARGWAEGDEVIAPSLTFVSTNHAVLHERLAPVLADVDEFLCLDPGAVERRITARTRAVVFVGMGGNTGQLPAIQRLCRERGLVLVLDAAHMAGTRLDGRTPEADAVAYSFHAVKNLPTADAGMICFAEAGLDALVRRKAWMGINRDTFSRTEQGGYAWQYDVESVGFKYHGNSVMAEIALAELPRLEAGNARRRDICAIYDRGVASCPAVRPVPVAPGCTSARHLYQVLVAGRDRVIERLRARRIHVGVHYQDNTHYRMFAGQAGFVPRARHASAHLLSLPLHLRLSDADVARVVDAVREPASAERRTPLDAPGPGL